MTVVVRNPPVSVGQMTVNYIEARYGLNLVEFARQLERDVLKRNESTKPTDEK
jgi:hypothetical protein